MDEAANCAARTLFVTATLLIAACNGGGSSSSETSAEPGPKAYAFSYRAKYVTGAVRGEFGSSYVTTFINDVQLLLLDLEAPETPPIVLDHAQYPLPYGQSLVGGAGDWSMLVPQDDPASTSTGIGQKIGRYLVYTKSGRLYLVDLLKTGTLPVPRQLSSFKGYQGSLGMARYDRLHPEKSYLSSADGAGGLRFVRLDMSASDEPLGALPFDAGKDDWMPNGASYAALLAKDGSALGGFRLSPQTLNADGRTYRQVLQHVDAQGKLVREFASVTIPWPWPDIVGVPLSYDVHPYLVWSSPQASVIAMPPGPAGVQAPGGYVIYKPATQEMVTGVLPALPLGGGRGPFNVLTESDRALFYTDANADGVLALYAVDKASHLVSAVRPDLKSPRALFNRWPYLVVVESNGQVLSIDLSKAGFPSVKLPDSDADWAYRLTGLGPETAVVASYPNMQVQSLATGSSVRFDNQGFLGWSASYTAAALQQPILSFLPAIKNVGGGSQPDGELTSYSPTKSVLPTHFLMAEITDAAAPVTGVSVATHERIALGELPEELKPLFESYPQPTYTGRRVYFHAVGKPVACASIPSWVVGTACTQYYSDILVADPAKAGSLRRLTNQADSRF